MPKVINLLLVPIFILYFALFFMQKTDLTMSDLGRHIKNGELLFTQDRAKVLHTNLYSYTEPNHVFVNHHWLTGIVFYTIFRFGGFEGLTLFSALLMGTVVFLMFSWVRSKNGIYTALFLTFLFLVFATSRVEVRPEIFSYFFIVAYIILFEKTSTKFFSRILPLLFVMQVLWVNLHIYFIFGLVIAGAFLLEALLTKNQSRIKQLVVTIVLLGLASCINPFGIVGALQPFTIFTNYGVHPSENYPISNFFKDKVTHPFLYAYFFTALCGIALILSKYLTKRDYKDVAFDALYILFLVLSLRMTRALPLFGIATFFLAAVHLRHVGLPQKFQIEPKLRKVLLPIYFLLVALTAVLAINFETFGLGLMPDNLKSANFFTEQKLKGPIFNNYDNGGYLIFNFYGTEAVFVDNRPEAYSVDFLREQYLRSFKEEVVWQELLATYKFNTIYLRTDCAKSDFVNTRVEEDAWQMQYLDPKTCILTKTSPETLSN